MDHMSSHKLLSDSQFGFRRNRSTVLQQLTVMEDWTEALDNNLQVDKYILTSERFSIAFRINVSSRN